LTERANEFYEGLLKGLEENSFICGIHKGMGYGYNEHYELAKIAEELGQFKRASELYEEREYLHDAARTAKAAGLTERANEFYEGLLKDLEERSKFKEALKLAEEAGLTEKAEIYLILYELLEGKQI
jgi:hypothetical protein